MTKTKYKILLIFDLPLVFVLSSWSRTPLLRLETPELDFHHDNKFPTLLDFYHTWASSSLVGKLNMHNSLINRKSSLVTFTTFGA